MKNQKFGVEIEMTGITREAAAEIVAKVLKSTVSGPRIGCYHTRTIKDTCGREWKIMRDSSIRTEIKSGESTDEHRVEFVTPPLNYNDIELLLTIVTALEKNGALTNDSCGIHVHVDGANHTPLSLRRLVNFMVSRQDLIYEALEVNQERIDEYCHKLSTSLLSDMKGKKVLSKEEIEEIWYSPSNDSYSEGINHEHYNNTRYHGINLHSYFTKKTVEFRLFNSTLHTGKITAYIQFCLAVSAWAIQSNDKITFHSADQYTPAQKVTLMRSILTQRLGLRGNEFRKCRLYIMEPLKRAAVNQEIAA